MKMLFNIESISRPITDLIKDKNKDIFRYAAPKLYLSLHQNNKDKPDSKNKECNTRDR